jgi:hypothetical protein
MANFEDGSKFIIGFRPKAPKDQARNVFSPNVNIMITTPEGETRSDFLYYKAHEGSIAKERCEVKMGPHSAIGDLKDYDVHFEPVNGVGADLHYHFLVEPFRPGGTAYAALGDNDEFYYTDMSIPKAEVTGTLTYDGKTVTVKGQGYHDHQWMNLSPFQAWHHWLWGRLYAGEYTIVIYDFVASKRFGFERIPILGILDGSGKVIFDNTQPVECKMTTYVQPELQRAFPKRSQYVFKDCGKEVRLDIEWLQEIEVRRSAKLLPWYGRMAMKLLGVDPFYMRYFAKADLTIIGEDKTVHESGNMIYEFNYMGKSDPRAHLK